MERKSLHRIAWNVTEEEYRADKAISYSTLAKYERTGFNGLDSLFDKVESPSLTFGSAVDSLITGGQEEFDNKFVVAEFPPIPDSITRIVKSLFNQYGETYRTLDQIEDRYILNEVEQQSYQSNWKPETRVKVIREKGTDYYNLLHLAYNKTIIDTQTYQDICNVVSVLKNDNTIGYYFKQDNPFEPEVERLYQLKFKAEFDGVNYRCMADLLIVDHKGKIILPIDLKTSSHTEWEFYKSFNDWRYDIQGRLYWSIIRQNMDKDEYFKNFSLLDYRFIVVNKKTLTPLIWVWSSCKERGEIKIPTKTGSIIYRDPFIIGKELYEYLENKPRVPNGIHIHHDNDIVEWLKLS